VLRVEDLEGKVIAHAVNFGAHPTMQDSKVLKFSADYPGAMAAVVEKETGAPCLFLQGAAGDLSANAGEFAGPEKFGKRLGQEVLELIKTITCKVADKPKLQVSEDDFRFKSRIDLGNPLIKGMFVKAFFQDLVDFYEREYREGVRPHLTVALLNNRIGFVGVSGEFFCSHSLNLKRRARLDHLFFLGYCNDYQQYFPQSKPRLKAAMAPTQAFRRLKLGPAKRSWTARSFAFTGCKANCRTCRRKRSDVFNVSS